MIFDIVILILLGFAVYAGYKYGTSKELYRLAKIFIGISLASSYGADFGQLLTKIGLLKANDWAVLTLTGFLLLFVLYWFIVYLLEKFFNHLKFEKSRLNRYLGMLSNFIQALLLLTFFSFMSTQLSFVKEGYKSYLVKNSFIYIHMDRLCRKIVTKQFVAALMDEKSGMSTKEALIKTLTDEKNLKKIAH